MPLRKGDILAQLQKYRSDDAVILGAVDSARQLLKQSNTAGRHAGIEIMVCNFSAAEKEFRESPLFTESCQVLLIVPLIVFNEQFLKELEAAIRSFAMSRSLLYTQYFQSDAGMFGLVQRVANSTERYLKRLRAVTEEKPEDESAIVEELTLAVFYFISHEIGHLLRGQDQHNYASFLNQNAPLEDRIANAVVKMGMHMDDLAEYGFTLGKGPHAETHYRDIKQVADNLRATVEHVIASHSKWFQDEKDADEQANRIAIEYLNSLERTDEQAADRMLHRFVRGLFVAAIYSWFKDLGGFLDKFDCGRTNNSQLLVGEMALNRERYIQAASLFGDVHRFTLLRANLTIEAVIRARCSWFQEDAKTRSIWYSRDSIGLPNEFTELKKRRLAENLQRYSMLCILMDTAVKMSFIGYSTGWMREMDKKRGTPQMFMMTFYSIPHELHMLKELR